MQSRILSLLAVCTLIVLAGCASGRSIFGGVTAFEMNQRLCQQADKFETASAATNAKVDKLATAVEGINKRLDGMTQAAVPAGPVDPRDEYLRRLRMEQATRGGPTSLQRQAHDEWQAKGRKLMSAAGLVNVSSAFVKGTDFFTGTYGEYTFRGQLSADGTSFVWSGFKTPRSGADAAAMDDADANWATYPVAQRTAIEAAYGYHNAQEQCSGQVPPEALLNMAIGSFKAIADPWK